MLFVYPNWNVPANIKAMTTTRLGGVSQGEYASLNLATHVGDCEADVMRNRHLIAEKLALPMEPVWLQQVHGTNILNLSSTPKPYSSADGAYSSAKNVVCTVMTADCLPLLLSDKSGSQVAAVPNKFEVGHEVREQLGGPESAYLERPNNKLLANLYALAGARLRRLGVIDYSHENACSYSNAEHFFSYRRDGGCGRMATFIWRESLR